MIWKMAWGIWQCLSEHSKVSKLGLWWNTIIQSRKFMRLKSTEPLCVITMKNDAKIDRGIGFSFQNWHHNLTNVVRALKCLKNLHSNGPLLTRVYNVWAKKVQKSEPCLMALKIDAKFKEKLTCAFKNDMRNLASFHRLKNSDFILESKKAELNLKKKSKQLDRPDAVRKLYFTLEINE